MVHNYKETLERMKQARAWRDGCTVQQQDAVISALEIADRLQSGVVSDDMYFIGEDLINSYCNSHDQSDVFKAMAEQLLKECE